MGGGIDEAPLDGLLYGRKNAAWHEVPKLTTLTYYRGAFANDATLKAEHPTDVSGAFAVVLATQTVWIWDGAWTDTGTTTTNAGITDAPSDGKTYGRKNAAWVENQGGIGSQTEVIHNQISGLQGGKVENGQITEAYHLTKEEWERLPFKPMVLNPANNAVNINQVPQIQGSPYSHPWDVEMYAKQIQIATDLNFATPVYDREEFSGSPVFQVPLKANNTPYLTQNTAYYVRIRYQDRKGRWSPWSSAVKFTTMAIFPTGLLATPVMVLPSDGGSLLRKNPVMVMTSPKVLAGAANFTKADWQISSDSTFATTIYNAADVVDLSMHATQSVNLDVAIGTEFFARGRQKTDANESTPWSIPARFTLLPEYDAPVFGLRRRFNRSLGVVFCWNIDADGKIVNIAPGYFAKHPLYSFAKQNVVIGQTAASGGTNVTSEMVYVPPVWEKCSVYEDSEGDLIIDLWFSATPKSGDGWFLDPAFARSPNGFLHSTSLVSSGSSLYRNGVYAGYCYRSNPFAAGVGYAGGSGAGDIDLVYFNNLNIADAKSPWHGWTIYERRLLLDLAAAEYMTQNKNAVSNLEGHGNMTTNYARISAKYRSFLGLWSVAEYATGDSREKAMICIPGWTGLGADKKWRVPLPSAPGSMSLSDKIALPISGVTADGRYETTDIHRGMQNVFGFDVALLGIPKNCVPWTPNNVGAFSLSFNWSATIPAKELTIKDYYCSLFGLNSAIPVSNNTIAYRVSKWLD